MGLLSFQVSLARIWRRHKQWDKREAYGQCAWWMRAPFYVKEAYSSFSGSSAGKLRKLPGHHFYFFMATMGIQYLPFIEEKNLELVYTIFWKYTKHLGFNSPCERRSLIIKDVSDVYWGGCCCKASANTKWSDSARPKTHQLLRSTKLGLLATWRNFSGHSCWSRCGGYVMRGFQGVSLICYTAQEKPTINYSVPGVNSRSPDVGGWKHHTMGTKD